MCISLALLVGPSLEFAFQNVNVYNYKNLYQSILGISVALCFIDSIAIYLF